MRFQRLDASFGVLEGRSLAFAPGLNVVEAPNERGKSTLAAFLRTMLYGLPTRDRGALADKNRYLPWSGAPMRGALELETEAFGAITLRRDTARANSPMGRFSAVYTGTGDAVVGLTAADCGETLLGVPREVYERSAFIRQSGLAIDPDAELERRIAALITTGEEGVSYSEASAALRKQLNARRSNARNGRIPTLEREIETDAAALAELRALQAEQNEAEAALAALRGREAALRAELTAHELADKQAQYAARERAKRDADDAAREARTFRRMLDEARVPPREVLEEALARLRAAEDLERQAADAEARRRDAETALAAFDAGPKPRARRLNAVCYLAVILASAAAFVWPRLGWYVAVPALVCAVLLALSVRRGQRRLAAHTQRRDALSDSLREAEAAYAVLKTQIERTLAPVRETISASDAKSYVDENLARYDALARLDAEAENKRRYCESLPAPELAGVPAQSVARPETPREALQAQLARITDARAAAQSRADRAAGRLQALGDAPEREAALARKRELLAATREEYDAIALAMETLERANAALQSRFSPALGKRAADYLAALTDGKYGAVALDRSFRAFASENGGGVSRDAALLSQGTGDQLYLAVRLAVCDLVLPETPRVPLVFDDALTSFDDARCAAALELLVRVAETRQVLLLTCQHREAAYLAGRAGVEILTL